MTVELRQLRYFIAVAEELHFTRAAERLRIAQPALSQQVAKLERDTGVELFHRTRRQVELSAAGQAMLRPARQAVAEASAAVEAAQRAARGETGHLRIGFIESAAMTFVPQAVRRFSATRPEVGLSLSELSVDAQVEGLRSGLLDIGILRLPASTEGLALGFLADEHLVVVLADSHPLAERKRISARSLAGEPLVLLAREMVPGLYDQIISLQQGHGGARVAQEATSIQAVLGLVAAGLGVSLLPASVTSLGRTGISFVRLAESPRSSIRIAWRESDRSPLTAAFLEAAVTAAGPNGRG
jgi:DNA-binding transcriptional LysR family regulator